MKGDFFVVQLSELNYKISKWTKTCYIYYLKTTDLSVDCFGSLEDKASITFNINGHDDYSFLPLPSK